MNDFWSIRKSAEEELSRIKSLPIKDPNDPYWKLIDSAIFSALKNVGKEEFLELTKVFLLKPSNSVDVAIAFRLRKGYV